MKMSGGLVGITLNYKAHTKYFLITPGPARLAKQAKQMSGSSSIAKNGKNPQSNSAAELPGEEETLSDKMSRFSSSSADFVQPSFSSYLSQNIFSQHDKETLFQLFVGMIRTRIISKQVVKDTLEKEEAGKEILCKFTVEQIINCTKYERRLNRRC